MILALYGAGAMGREFLEIAKEQGTWSDIVFIDDNAAEEIVSGVKVYSFQAFLNRFTADQVRFVISIGEPKYRLEAYEHMKQAGYTGGRLIHPEVYVAPDAEIGEGAALCFGSFVGSKARIGCNFYASVRASIGHDSVIGDHTRVGAGAFIGGHTTVGNNSFIGSGAMLKDRIHVGSGCVVALGAAVFQNVPDGATVVGNPARVTGEGTAQNVYGTVAPKAAAPAAKKVDRGTLAEKYWEVFSECFDGIDFNPITFRFHDEGWDSIAQMSLICGLEEAFGISIKGRETLKINSYKAGLQMVRKKLEEKK